MNLNRIKRTCYRIREKIIASDNLRPYLDKDLAGTCAIASRLVYEKLKSQGYSVKFCKGKFIENRYDEDDSFLCDHCWVELEFNNQIYIVDLTLTQFIKDANKVSFIQPDNKIFLKYKAKNKFDIELINFQRVFQKWPYYQMPFFEI